MSTTRSITVSTSSRVYPVVIGSNCLDDREFWQEQVGTQRVAIVTNAMIASHFLARLQTSLPAHRMPALVILLDDGESHKTWDSVLIIFEALLAAGCDRDTVLIALGGGVIGDLTGFAAATYQRGIDFIQVPTTLLAQVDSSVGGKTGFNLAAGKNMIGAFHQPRAVLADVAGLRSLSLRELRAGLAEVIKHGAMADPALFAYLEIHMPALLAQDASALMHVVEASVRIKASIVGTDERESGLRALLNFGHTFGHAIEAGLGYGTWLHGEAVAAGMVLAAELSAFCGVLDAQAVVRLRALIRAAGLPTVAPAFDPARWLTLMASDKKSKGGALRFILLDSIGSARVVPIANAQIEAFLTAQAGILAS